METQKKQSLSSLWYFVNEAEWLVLHYGNGHGKLAKAYVDYKEAGGKRTNDTAERHIKRQEEV